MCRVVFYHPLVQSVVKEEVLHYRVDTSDALDILENSFLVGRETVVLEQRKVIDPAASNSQLVTALAGSDGWTLASIKGPQLWSDVEVCSVCVDSSVVLYTRIIFRRPVICWMWSWLVAFGWAWRWLKGPLTAISCL